MSKLRQSEASPDADTLVRTYAVTHPPHLGIGERVLVDWDLLSYASQGVATVKTPSGTWVVPPHRAVWIPRGVAHSVTMSGAVTMRSLFFAGSCFLEHAHRQRQCRSLHVSPLLRELLLYTAERGRLRRSKPEDLRLAHVILDQVKEVPAEALSLPTPSDERARRLAAYLLRNSGRDTLTRAIARSGASRRTLERLFRQQTGITLGAWWRRSRILHALQLFARGDSVTCVALEVGFSTPSAFVVAFKREVGRSPGRTFSDEEVDDQLV